MLPEFLTRREAEVLYYMGEGYTNQQIAEELHISVDTVKTHVKKVRLKKGVTGRRGGWPSQNSLPNTPDETTWHENIRNST